jgi:hypothetical protein
MHTRGGLRTSPGAAPSFLEAGLRWAAARHFCDEQRAQVKADDPSLQPNEVMKALGARWNAMETDEKAKYDRWLKAASTILRRVPHLPWCLPGSRPFRRTPERRRARLGVFGAAPGARPRPAQR